MFILSTVVSPLSVVIEEVSEPFSGSEYILSCIVTVDDSVNTDITISSQWLVPEAVIGDNSVTYSIETMGNLEQRNDMMFSPLQFHHEGMYTCSASVNAQKNEFIDEESAASSTMTSIIVYCKLCA